MCRVVKAKRTFHDLFPWGYLFAYFRNFKAGYLTTEAEMVRRFLKKSSTILILGSGNGREAWPLRHQGHTIICMDMGLGYLLSGIKLCLSEHIKKVHFVQGDMFRLPFAALSFDAVFYTLYSFSSLRRFTVMEDIKRVLRPEGIVFQMAVTKHYYMTIGVKSELVLFADRELLRRDIERCGFELLDGATDPARREYLFALIRPRND